MADCLSSKLLAEIGTVLTNITVANGYDTTTVTVKYDDFILTRKPADYPCHEVIPADYDLTDISQNTQELLFTIHVLSYRILTSASDTLTGRKQHLEFAADIRTALLSTYTRQQAGTFVMPQFLNIVNIRQTLFTSEQPQKTAGVYTMADYKFDAQFTDR